ncbi:MAG: EAL domain-containing protein [Oscillospiraceae bacterium]|jgi:EAL domain-containing protein (putative c-di-GMP-specific phosphodiesterase class I)/GGDEF domain-containing protein|nr:EAL domain-containing protein [Oscillospiraceae bacterium]
MKLKHWFRAVHPLILAACLSTMWNLRKKSLLRQVRLQNEDALTGGANERQFMIQARRFLENTERKNYAVIAFHVKEFGVINEMFGYPNGTKVLRGIQWVFTENLKKDELSAHVYADRFLLLLFCRNRSELNKRLRCICTDLKKTIEFYGIRYELSPAFGICECPADTVVDIQEWVNRAVIALKAETHLCRPPFVFYEDRMRIDKMTLKNMEDRLEPAMKNHEFVVYYQPKYSAESETLYGAEALVRWRTAPDTLVPPGEFIPVFEQDGKIEKLDRYIFRQVCRDLRHWMDDGKNVVPVSVNLSRVNLLNPSVAAEYRSEAATFGIPLNLLELEVTESAFAQDAGNLEKSMKRLNAAGFALAIDDFGSEYSSLKMLYDIPVQTMKLDRDFLNGLGFGQRGKEVISAVVGLARQLHLQVVAEGVETKEQLEFLKQVGCTAVQGYYFSKPIPESQYAALLSETQKKKESVSTV